MTAIVLPDIDRSTLQELQDRMPSLKLSEIELPSMEHAGREADRTIDQLLGRSRPTVWPWVAAAVGLAAIVGTAIALFTWYRRPTWPSADGGINGATLAEEVDPVAGANTTVATEGGRP